MPEMVAVEACETGVTVVVRTAEKPAFGPAAGVY